jgi:hypothetical protein
MKDDNPYGDDGGARVGKPDTPKRDNLEGGGDGGDLGAGKESTGGVAKHGNPDTAPPPRSKPIDREQRDDPGYGGNRGGPKPGSDRS